MPNAHRQGRGSKRSPARGSQLASRSTQFWSQGFSPRRNAPVAPEQCLLLVSGQFAQTFGGFLFLDLEPFLQSRLRCFCPEPAGPGTPQCERRASCVCCVAAEAASTTVLSREGARQSSAES